MKSTMRAPVESKAVFVSLRCYERLLAVYPERHRREYGFPMAQLFRDQCRDAWRESRSRGLVTLWLRVLPDLVKTSVLEHLATMKGRKSMVEKISEITNVNTAPLRTFLTVFLIVFLLVFGASAIITFLLPEAFQSTVRVKVERNSSASANQNDSRATYSGYDPYFLQTEFEIIQSEVVLRKVVEQLDLNTAWGKKYAGGEKLKTPEAIMLLKGRMDLRPVRNTSLIAISVFSEDPREAAKIANAIAESYRDHPLERGRQLTPKTAAVEIVDKAMPGMRPVRPNKLLNIVLGIVIGILLGSAVGAGTAGIAALIGRKSRGGSATPRTGASPPPVTPHPADGRHAKGTTDKIMGLLWMGMSVFLSGLGLLALFWAFGDVPKFPDSLIIPLFGIFWGGNVVAGFFLFRGKSWARICIGVEAVLLVTYFLSTVGAPVPRSLRWVLIVFGSITACALFWPRKQTAANPR